MFERKTGIVIKYCSYLNIQSVQLKCPMYVQGDWLHLLLTLSLELINFFKKCYMTESSGQNISGINASIFR